MAIQGVAYVYLRMPPTSYHYRPMWNLTNCGCRCLSKIHTLPLLVTIMKKIPEKLGACIDLKQPMQLWAEQFIPLWGLSNLKQLGRTWWKAMKLEAINGFNLYMRIGNGGLQFIWRKSSWQECFQFNQVMLHHFSLTGTSRTNFSKSIFRKIWSDFTDKATTWGFGRFGLKIF